MIAYVFIASALASSRYSDSSFPGTHQQSSGVFSSLPLQLAIKNVKGEGKRKLVVFSDPDCPYCRRLERETLRKMDNITIYTFLLPLEQHSDASRKAALIWCSKDKSKAWHDWMLDNKLPATSRLCMAPLEGDQKLAQQLGIHGTPTLIFEDGRASSGTISPEELNLRLHNF